MRKTLFAIFATLALTSIASATVIVDDFTTPTASVTACAPPLGAPGTSAGPSAATNTISGERSINAQVTALLGVAGGCSQVGTNSPSGNSVLDVANQFGVFGKSTVTWDVPGSVSAAGETLLSIDIGIDGGITPNDTSTFTITFCSDDACTNSYTRQWSITGQVAPPANYQFALGSFTANGAPSWGTITKASFVVDSGNSSDLRIDNIVLTTPEPSSMILLGSALAGFAMLRRRRS